MKQIRNLLILFFLGFGSLTYSFPSEEIELDGTIKSIKEKEGNVLSKDFIYTVPRDLIFLSDLKAEQRIIVPMAQSQFTSLKRTPANKK